MGAVFRRPFKQYNIDSRAMKMVERAEKSRSPVNAPRHPSQAALEARSDANRDDDSFDSRSAELDERLKKVYVESKGDNPVITTKRKLPESRERVEDFEYGYLIPTHIPAGRISLKQCLDMLKAHREDKEKNSAKVLAAKYNLDLVMTYKILNNFQLFNVHLPQAKDATMVRQAHPKLQARKMKQAQKIIDRAFDAEKKTIEAIEQGKKDT